MSRAVPWRCSDDWRQVNRRPSRERSDSRPAPKSSANGSEAATGCSSVCSPTAGKWWACFTVRIWSEKSGHWFNKPFVYRDLLNPYAIESVYGADLAGHSWTLCVHAEPFPGHGTDLPG